MQQLSVDMLKTAGAFAPAKPERKEIEWMVDGRDESFKAIVYVRKKSFLTLIEESKSAKESDLAIASKISSSIVDAEGKPIFHVGDVIGNEDHGPMCAGLSMALLAVIYEVNGLGLEADPKQSQPMMSSGVTSSSQESAETRSKEQSKT
ncbi:phage tail assembly chaperone family protein, TAC [Vibrio porteresiae]|uniref:Phage tail assembly chaperone family protein, TAC n=1 Tax=Vibrio porteresiae DSM 19223 TaxID=1123496 RepID=A0ABZ0QBG3_9VIBR|nr:phage tail assembly chaperone family protein, TAC [Vibrio porteresiae]WPC72920.1 phage tail assembly chaperone family protein, TAC [Vibrio porteresiae DSM 19223]